MLLALAASGCGDDSAGAQAATDGAPQRGGEIVVSLAKEPPIINPWLAPGAMAVTNMLVDGLNDPIVTLDEQGVWQPVLAERVPTPANGDVQTTPGGGMTISFTIRERAAWSDGVPLRCEDVVFTWKTVMTPDYQLSNRLGWDQVEAIDCPTPRRVVIHMKRPYALYMSRILALGPLPAHELRGKDFNTFWNSRITISSGPFLFGEWQRGVRLVLRRNRDYWNSGKLRRPLLDKVTFRFVKDANTLKMQLRMNEADVAFIPADTNLVEELKATPDIAFASLPGAVVEQLVLQTGRPPLDDRDVRLALAYAIDRAMITDVVLKGQVKPLQQTMVPSQAVYATDSFSIYHPNPAKVREHLERAGWQRAGGDGGAWTKGGKQLEMTYVVGAGSMPFRASVGQLLQQQLKRQGIKLTLQQITPEVLYSQVAPKGSFDIGEWSEPTGIEPDPSLLFGCDQIPRKPQWAGKNRYRWCDREVDAMLHRADAMVNPAERAKLVAEIDHRIGADVPLLPLFRSPDTVAWSLRVHGLKPNAAMNHTWNMADWWVAQ